MIELEADLGEIEHSARKLLHKEILSYEDMPYWVRLESWIMDDKYDPKE